MTRPSRWILVVDDDEDIRSSVADVLEATGFEVQLAANGQEALDVIHRNAQPPCLILLDLMMPVMDGWALIEVLKRDDALSSIPVVVFSAHRHPTHVTPLDTPKAVLSKPLSMAQLIRTVERWAA